MKVYHLNITKKDIKGAKIALLPGDPARVPKIAKFFDIGAQEIAYKREYRTYLGKIGKENVLVVSTGIGGASTSICVDELAQLGVKYFIRVGTCGAIQDYINVGDVIITSGAVRIDGVSNHYAPIEYPAVAHHTVVSVLIEAAEKLKIKYYVGITASSATFYPGQERYDGYSKYIIREFQKSKEELKKLNVLNYEMESATLLTMCSVFRLYGGCITGVIDTEKNREITPSSLKKGEENVISVVCKAIGILAEKI